MREAKPLVSDGGALPTFMHYVLALALSLGRRKPPKLSGRVGYGFFFVPHSLHLLFAFFLLSSESLRQIADAVHRSEGASRAVLLSGTYLGPGLRIKSFFHHSGVGVTITS